MNLKKAKMIRKAMRIEGIDPRQVSYNKELPYVSAWFSKDLLTLGQKQTDIPLKVEACGRRLYKTVKRDLKTFMQQNPGKKMSELKIGG